MHFTIDSDNILTVHETAPAAEPDTIAVTTEKDLKKATADWPIARLVEVWNGFAGVVPLGDLRQVKKFTDRATAVKRISDATYRLTEQYNQERQARSAAEAAPAGRQSRKASAMATAAARVPAETPVTVIPAPAPKPAPEPTERKRRSGARSATVIALLERVGGASIEEIGEATGWQKHTIRAFVSTRGKKEDSIASVRREDGARVYSVEKWLAAGPHEFS